MDEETYIQISRYSQPTIILLGFIGAIFNQILFRRHKFLRSASCSLYFRVSSINDLLVLFMIVLPQWLNDQFHLDLTHQFVWFCKLRTYTMYCLYAISPYCIVLGCFDRLCRTSCNIYLRQMATLPNARQMVSVLILVIFLLYSHILYEFTVVHSTCLPSDQFYVEFLGYFLLIFYCLLPSILMSVCCGYTLSSLNRRRQKRKLCCRRSSSTSHVPRRRDYYLVKLLVLYVATNIICILPFTMVFLFNVYQRRSDSQKLLAIKFSELLLNVNYCTSFYVYTLGTPLYRRELLRSMKRFLKWLVCLSVAFREK